MDILIVSYQFPPKTSVGGLRAYSFAKTWTQLGHSITVLTVKQNEVESQEIRFSLNSENCGKIIQIADPEIDSNKNWLTKKIKKVFKTHILLLDAQHLWVKKVIAYLKKQQQRYDIVVTTSVPLSAHLIPLKLKKIAPFWIADFRDLPEQVGKKKETYSNLFKLIYREYIKTFYEKRIMDLIKKNANMLTTVSKGLADILSSRKTQIIYNGYFAEYFTQEIREIENIILYTGSIDCTQIISPLLNVIKKINTVRNDKIILHIYSKISEKYYENIKEYLNFIIFFSPLNISQITKFQQKSLFLLLVTPLHEKGVMLTKSFEYFAAKRPIIALTSKESELAQTLELNKHPAYFCGYDEKELEQFIEFWLQHEPQDCDFASQKLIDSFSRENQAKQLLEIIDQRQNI